MTPSEFQAYNRALVFAATKHGDQKRKYTGDPYIVHLIRVAGLVANAGASSTVIQAALLHDVLEDTATTLDELRATFGEEVAAIVLRLTDSGHEVGNREIRKALDRERLAKAGHDAQTIKLADLIDNTSSIVEHDARFARIYLKEQRLLLDVLNDGEPTLKAAAEQAWVEANQRLHLRARLA